MTHSTEPLTSDEHSDSKSALEARNPFLDCWLEAIASDTSLPPEALAVAKVMALSVGIGRASFTDWQRINASLGQERRDLKSLKIMSELQSKGYIDRNFYDGVGLRRYGWTLLIPEVNL
ncbi:hypothetical protein SAMN04489743_1100 [Pseudarthrobacter equi]|uniref:Uncharacterized protein n=1 Tax=Pseudarthrobacter equi TaxID=728066 RepID=A0A1H1VU43_9MICC|nr:hypothetical protein [Pseudarthrobacter equi]SDS87971.1 hypothetical protein SAMN04489743_1100 [Pseudarthrobacter equi]